MKKGYFLLGYFLLMYTEALDYVSVIERRLYLDKVKRIYT